MVALEKKTKRYPSDLTDEEWDTLQVVRAEKRFAFFISCFVSGRQEFFFRRIATKSDQDAGKPKDDCPEDKSEIVSCCCEDGIDGVALLSEEKVSVESSVIFHVSDGCFDGGSSFEFATDGRAQAAFLT